MSKEAKSINFARRSAVEVPSWIAKAQDAGAGEVVPLRSLTNPSIPPGSPGIRSAVAATLDEQDSRHAAERPSDTFPVGERVEPIEEALFRVEREKTERLQNSLCDAIEQLSRARKEHVENAENQLIELSLTLAARLANDQIKTDPGRVRHLVKEGLEALTAEDKYEIELGSDFSEALPEVEEYVASRGLTCKVKENPMLANGAVVVRSELGSVDESLESRITALAQALHREFGP